MFQGIPIIGLVGGIGSGKSTVAKQFAALGCVVIDSDAQAHAAYGDPAVRQAVREWWGDSAFDIAGNVNRKAVAQRVFESPGDRKRLEALIHPLVAQARDQQMAAVVEAVRSGSGKRPLAFVWDTPLLFEAGLKPLCDAVVFVDAPLELRQQRVARSRGWGAGELSRRENLQWPLDRKKKLSDDIVSNTVDAEADAGKIVNQVRQAFSRILSRIGCFPGLD